jgi:hypothetical protein
VTFECAVETRLEGRYCLSNFGERSLWASLLRGFELRVFEIGLTFEMEAEFPMMAPVRMHNL